MPSIGLLAAMFTWPSTRRINSLVRVVPRPEPTGIDRLHAGTVGRTTGGDDFLARLRGGVSQKSDQFSAELQKVVQLTDTLKARTFEEIKAQTVS